MTNKVTTSNKTDDKIRLDKWLWAARFFKTRSLAQDAIRGGKVQIGNRRAKASSQIEIDVTVAINLGIYTKTVIATGLSDKRGNAQTAALLYRETEDSIIQREKQLQQYRDKQLSMPASETKPTKKQRRQIIRFQRKD